MTLSELAAGWASTPVSISDLDVALAPLTPRFAIRERRGPNQPKIRPVDDFRAIGVNELVPAVETDVPATSDAALSLKTR